MREIYLEHGPALFRDLCRVAGPAEAESVVHDVFVELLRNRDLRSRFTGGALYLWLRQIARLKAFEHFRKVRRNVPQDVPEAFESPEPELEARDVLARFLAQVVPPRQRDFFTLRFLENHTQIEIAARLGVPRSTLEGWEHALTAKLRVFVLEGAS